MAVMHQATLRPTKLELLNVWLPGRSWYQGPSVPDVQRVAAYRFDDPAGEVGVETMLVQADGGPLLQIPLTYRAAPLDGAQEWLVGTTDHSVLGKRWVYDGCGDPVYAGMLASTILDGSGEAAEFVEIDGQLTSRATTTHVKGSGTSASGTTITTIVRVHDSDLTRIVTDSVELTVVRILDGRVPGDEELTLTGTWIGQPESQLLAYATE